MLLLHLFMCFLYSFVFNVLLQILGLKFSLHLFMCLLYSFVFNLLFQTSMIHVQHIRIFKNLA